MYLILKIFLFCLLTYNFSNEGLNQTHKLELLIEEYILENPEIIIKSLENYRSLQEAKIEEESKYFINDYYDRKIYDSLPSQEMRLGQLLLLNLLITIVDIVKRL